MTRRLDPAARRRAQLAAIHSIAKKLDMEEDTYRNLIERVSGEYGAAVRSAGKCSPRQLEAVLDALRRSGGVGHWPGRPAGELSPLLRKIEALLADAGRQWAYATAVAKRICKVDRLEWCDDEQLGKVVAALQIDADRHGRGRRRRRG
jgi:phage gp16-like protein